MCVITTAVAGSVGAMVAANAALGASLVGSLVSAGVGIAGAVQQGQAAEAQAEYEYEVAMYEAEIARQQGELEQIKHGIDARRQRGLAIARASKYGDDLSFGNRVDQFAELARFNALEQQNIARNAKTAVLGARLRGAEALSRGRNARMASTFTAVGSAFSAAASVGGIVTDLTFAGAFSSGGPASSSRLTAGQRVNDGSLFRNRLPRRALN